MHREVGMVRFRDKKNERLVQKINVINLIENVAH